MENNLWLGWIFVLELYMFFIMVYELRGEDVLILMVVF